jgi:PKD repeat protein
MKRKLDKRNLGKGKLLAFGAIAAAGLIAALSLGGGSTNVRAQSTPACATPTPTQTTVAYCVSITATPTPGQSGQQSSFTATIYGVPTGTDPASLIYQWSFGDGSAGATGKTVTHTYAMAGTYAVQVVVSGAPQPTSASLQYTVIQGLSIAPITPTTGQINQPITFMATPVTGTTFPADTTFTWDFGDSHTATGQTVQHSYSTASTFTLTVTAKSASTGQAGSQTADIVIGGQSTLTITGPTTGVPTQTLIYSVASSGLVPSDAVFTWNFGDSTPTQTGMTVNHQFATAGTYTVKVTAASATNAAFTSSAQQTVTISSATPGGPSVTYQTGWNLVGGGTGTTFSQANGPLYTFQAGDTTYESLPNTSGITGGRGYWAYFTAPTTVALSSSGPTLPVTVTLPANQYVMVGNPSQTQTVTVSGASVVWLFDTAGNNYTGGGTSASLPPGKGAWVLSTSGGTVTIQ